MPQKLNQTLKSQVIALVATVLAFLFWYFLLDYQRQKGESEAYIESSAYASLLQNQLDSELSSLLFISNGLSSFIKVYRNELQQDKMQAILADLWSNARYVRNLAVAVNYKITYVYPEQGNEAIIGVDYRNVSLQWPKVKLAIDSRQGVLDGPIDLIQGGSGIVYRYPIFVDGHYWGILSTVIDTDSFLRDIFKDIQNPQFKFAIRAQDHQRVFYGDAALFNQKNSYILQTRLPNQKWEWAISNQQIQTLPSRRVSILLSAILSLLIGWLAYFFAQERYYLSEGALMDSLTGLANRRLLESRLNYAHSEAKRDRKRFGLMALDIDHFKSINDQYGHDVGDEVIKAVAASLKSNIRDADTVSRLGGDEFVIVLKDQQSEQGLVKVANKLLDMFNAPMHINGKEITVHLSIGLTLFDPGTDVTLKQLLKEADMALYQAKHAGRNTYSFWK